MANKNKHRSISSNSSSQVSAVEKTVKTGGKSFSQEFNPDYTFVKQDLKKIAILFSVFLVILVVLSFILK